MQSIEPSWPHECQMPCSLLLWFILSCLGATPVVLRVYSWLCAQGTFLVKHWIPYVVVGYEIRLSRAGPELNLLYYLSGPTTNICSVLWIITVLTVLSMMRIQAWKQSSFYSLWLRTILSIHLFSYHLINVQFKFTFKNRTHLLSLGFSGAEK